MKRTPRVGDPLRMQAGCGSNTFEAGDVLTINGLTGKTVSVSTLAGEVTKPMSLSPNWLTWFDGAWQQVPRRGSSRRVEAMNAIRSTMTLPAMEGGD